MQGEGIQRRQSERRNREDQENQKCCQTRSTYLLLWTTHSRKEKGNPSYIPSIHLIYIYKSILISSFFLVCIVSYLDDIERRRRKWQNKEDERSSIERRKEACRKGRSRQTSWKKGRSLDTILSMIYLAICLYYINIIVNSNNILGIIIIHESISSPPNNIFVSSIISIINLLKSVTANNSNCTVEFASKLPTTG